MTIDEAIEILNQEYNLRLILNQIEVANALKMGISAIKLVQDAGEKDQLDIDK